MMGLALAALAEQTMDRRVQEKRGKGEEKKRHKWIEPKSSNSKASSTQLLDLISRPLPLSVICNSIKVLLCVLL